MAFFKIGRDPLANRLRHAGRKRERKGWRRSDQFESLSFHRETETASFQAARGCTICNVNISTTAFSLVMLRYISKIKTQQPLESSPDPRWPISCTTHKPSGLDTWYENMQKQDQYLSIIPAGMIQTNTILSIRINADGCTQNAYWWAH